MVLADCSSWLAVIGLAVVMAEGKPWWDRSSTTTPNPNPNSKLTASYFFPYACSVVYMDYYFKQGLKKSATWVSSCTILNQNWVAASADSFNFRAPDTRLFMYQDLSKLQVYAGTTYGNPSSTATGLKNILKLDVQSFVTLVDEKFALNNKSDAFSVSGSLDKKLILDKTAKKTRLDTLEWDVAFVKVGKGFTWSPQILPAPVTSNDKTILSEKVTDFLTGLEEEGHLNCVVAGWDRLEHRLGYYTVNFIPMEMCQAAYCAYDTRACLNFPDPHLHICFKSVDYQSDVCPEDRGSALYCKEFDDSVLAIATTAPNCGFKNLPAVYTRIDRVVQAMAQTGSVDPIQVLSSSDLNGYTLSPPELDS